MRTLFMQPTDQRLTSFTWIQLHRQVCRWYGDIPQHNKTKAESVTHSSDDGTYRSMRRRDARTVNLHVTHHTASHRLYTENGRSAFFSPWGVRSNIQFST